MTLKVAKVSNHTFNYMALLYSWELSVGLSCTCNCVRASHGCVDLFGCAPLIPFFLYIYVYGSTHSSYLAKIPSLHVKIAVHVFMRVLD